jgi:hypothetical protein
MARPTVPKLVAVAALAFSVLAAFPASASPTDARSLARAETIRAQLDARYRQLPGPGLRVTEAGSTDVVGTFALLTPDLLEARFLPADNGIWYAICPVRATCPYPARRFSRSAAALAPRRLALELALRTFLETSADVVGVSLPTPIFIALIVDRAELEREVDIRALARALSGDPASALPATLQTLVDTITRPRVFVFAGLDGGWWGIPRWPTQAP